MCWPAPASRTWAAIRFRSGPARAFTCHATNVHCIENSGPDVMQILGVFHPGREPGGALVRDAAAAEAATT